MRVSVVGRGAAAGVAAGLAALAVMEVGARLTGFETLPALVQDPLLARTPGPVFGFLIDSLSHWGKVLEEAGLLAALAVAFGLLGVAAGALWKWRPAAVWGVLTAAAAWLLVVLVLLPLAGQGFLGLRGGPARIVFWTVVFVVFAVVLEALLRMHPGTEPADPGRRRLLIALPGGVAAASLASIAVVRVPGWMRSAAAVPESTGPRQVPALTPADRFYVVSKNFDDPVVAASGWALRVGGLAGRTLALSLSELEAIPGVTETVTLECVSNEVGGLLMSTGRFSGVPLRDLLTMAEPLPDAQAVRFRSRDGYEESLALAAVMQDAAVLVAHRLNGEPLPSRHGYPARLVVPGRYGMKGPKWLDSVELAPAVVDGYWEQRGWDREAVVRTTARFDVPAYGALLHVGARSVVAGVAFAGLRGVQAVEFSADAGRTWLPASLEPPLGPLTWVRWHSTWTPARSGGVRLTVRARDGAGELQTQDERGSFPAGATGYHEIDVYVAG